MPPRSLTMQALILQPRTYRRISENIRVIDIIRQLVVDEFPQRAIEEIRHQPGDEILMPIVDR